MFGRDKHFTADHYASLMDTRGYTFFATVRNPWDQMVSLYYFRKQTGTGDWQTHAPETFDKAEFRQFLQAREPTQVSFLGRQRVRLLRFERLQQDFAALSQSLGLGALTLDKINASRRQRYQDVLDAELAAEIGTLYAEDVRRFGYSFAG